MAIRRPAHPVAFAPAGLRDLPIPGASGVAISAAGLLLVEDDIGIYRLRGARAALWAGADVHPSLADLEGITVSADGQTVWALSEEDAHLIELHIVRGRPRLGPVVRLARPGSRRNKGFEGLAFLPAALSPTRRGAFVAVHEHKPRRVCLFDAVTHRQSHDLRLPPDAKAVLDDLADVAVDPVSGALVLLSEESRRLAVMTLAPEGLRLLATYDLPFPGDERPEGLAFQSPTRVVVVTEGPARLLTLRVVRRGAE